MMSSATGTDTPTSQDSDSQKPPPFSSGASMDNGTSNHNTATTTDNTTSMNSAIDSTSNVSTTIERNIVRPFGYSCVDCGYCKGSRSHLVNKPPSESSKSYGLLAEKMTPTIYEQFIAQGWRRSGIHLYKPVNFESCCPTLTIRLQAGNFHISKSQSKVWKKMSNLLRSLPPPSTESSSSSSTPRKNQNQPRKKKKMTNTTSSSVQQDIGNKTATTTTKIKKNKTEKISSRLEEQAVEDSALWTELKRLAQQSLTSTLSSSSSLPQIIRDRFSSVINSSSSSNSNDEKTSYTSIVSNITWKTRKPTKQDSKLGRLKVSCSVCAQLAGKFQLQPSVRDQILENFVANWQQQQETDNIPSYTVSETFSIVSVEGHKGSGQMVVTLQLTGHVDDNNNHDVIMTESSQENNDDDDDNNMSDRINKCDDDDDEEDLSMKVVDNDGDDANDVAMDISMKDILSNSKSNNNDKLGQWYEQHTGNALAISDRKINVKTLPAHQSALLPETHKLFCEYQHIVHQDPDPFTYDPQQPPETIDLDQLDWGNAPQYFKDQIGPILREYIQSVTIKDKTNEKAIQNNLLANYYSYYQFLVESPFPIPQEQGANLEEDSIYAESTFEKGSHNNGNTNHRPIPCGTYHQHYTIGNVLIAVGVVDILPQGLSSVYLYYLPGFSHTLVALGKYAILYEVDYTRITCQLPYYYLGYYIESCQKMKYKGDYKPSQLLCPVHFQWVDATPAVEALKKASPLHVCALYEEDTREEGADGVTENRKARTVDQQKMAAALNEINLDIGAGMNITLPMLQESGQEVVGPILNDFLLEAGPELAKQCLVKLA